MFILLARMTTDAIDYMRDFAAQFKRIDINPQQNELQLSRVETKLESLDNGLKILG